MLVGTIVHLPTSLQRFLVTYLQPGCSLCVSSHSLPTSCWVSDRGRYTFNTSIVVHEHGWVLHCTLVYSRMYCTCVCMCYVH